MFDNQVGLAFVKSYYEKFLTRPLELEVMYAQCASFSHADVQAFIPSNVHNAHSGCIQGLEGIRVALQQLQNQVSVTPGTPHMKVCFAHLDVTPSFNSTMNILAGGYFLFRDGACRFVHNFMLQSTSVQNNFVILSDVLRTYPKQTDVVDAVQPDNTYVASQNHHIVPTPELPVESHVPKETPPHKKAQATHKDTQATKTFVKKQHASRGRTAAAAEVVAEKNDAVEKAVTSKPAPANPFYSDDRATNGRREWSDMMDEADLLDAAEQQDQDAPKVPLSSYAAAVRAAADAKVTKPAQKVGGTVTPPASVTDTDEVEDQSDAATRGPGNHANKYDRNQNHDGKRTGRGGYTHYNKRGGYTQFDGQAREGKSTFVKYSAILKNLPFNCTDDEIMELMAPHVKVTAIRNGTKIGGTYAFLKFDDESMIPTIQETGLSLRDSIVYIESVVDNYASRWNPSYNKESVGAVADPVIPATTATAPAADADTNNGTYVNRRAPKEGDDSASNRKPYNYNKNKNAGGYNRNYNKKDQEVKVVSSDTK